ncbi:MAG: hypothetical protein LUC83_09955 [Clostridiales bacterium]|nr:hypothetical protein [Clostridiales bacterium]
MKDKIKGTILAVAGGIGTVWALLNITPHVIWAVAFVFCAVICADGVTTVAADCRRWDDEERIRDGKER